MRNLKTGQFFGNTNEIIRLDGLILTDTEYTHEKVDWHYHECPYVTFILQGNVLEGNKKEPIAALPDHSFSITDRKRITISNRRVLHAAFILNSIGTGLTVLRSTPISYREALIFPTQL